MQNLTEYEKIEITATNSLFTFNIKLYRFGKIVNCVIRGDIHFNGQQHLLGNTMPVAINIPETFKPVEVIRSFIGGGPLSTNYPIIGGEIDLSQTTITLFNASTTNTTQHSQYAQANFTYISS